MQSKDFSFPQYRKFKSRDIWYKIESLDRFIEINRVGERYVQHEVNAIQFPEKLRIQDMLKMEGDVWMEITEEDFNTVEQKVN